MSKSSLADNLVPAEFNNKFGSLIKAVLGGSLAGKSHERFGAWDFRASVFLWGTKMTQIYIPATRPTMYFIGVSTGRSSIMKVFPRWAEYLGISDAQLKGIDFPLHLVLTLRSHLTTTHRAG